MVLIGLLENWVGGLCWCLFPGFPAHLARGSSPALSHANDTGAKAVPRPAKPQQTKLLVHKH